uniref:Uncharacterized protein n=1 Tax=Rhipicephalus zambeziensis TaxID=60191 RepID=A0A224YCX7_9ACAR
MPNEMTRWLSMPHESATVSETDRLGTRLQRHGSLARTLLQRESSPPARPPFSAIAAWLSDLIYKKRCVFSVYISRLFYETPAVCSLPCRGRARRWSVLLFWASRVSSRRRAGGDERCLSTMSVTSVNAGCPCINVYIYSLTNIVPRHNPFAHLPSSVFFPRFFLRPAPWCC